MSDRPPPDRLRVPLLSPDEPGRDGTTVAHTADASGPRLSLRRRTFDLASEVVVMGIVNRTPDSFYDAGATFELETALAHARRLVADGADIVDVGGVKGGPGDEVPVGAEVARVVPFVTALRAEDPDVVISVDTYRAPVAEAALAAGADIVNDVTGLSDPEVLDVVARHGAGYVAMHHGGEPRTRPYRRTYAPDVTRVVVDHCRDLAARAVDTGVDPERVIVDPGHDFQKTTAHSLELSRRLPELAALGFPVLVALSNKDFIGETLGAPLDGRVDGSLAAAVFTILRGANILRVHQVARTRDVVRMTETLLGWRPPAVAVRGLE